MTVETRYYGIFIDVDFDEDEEIRGYILLIPSEGIQEWYPTLEAVNEAVRLAASNPAIMNLMTI